MHSSDSGAKGATSKKIIKNVLLNAIVILTVSAAFLTGSVGAAGSVLLSGETFPEGTAVGGIDISGLTHYEGREKIESNTNSALETLYIELNYDGNIVSLNASDLSLNYDVEAALEAFSDKSGNSLIDCISAVFSPGNPNGEGLPLIYDREKIVSALEKALSPFDKLPENAQVVFDKNGEITDYLQEAPGRKAKIAPTADAVIESLEKSNSSIFTVEYDIIKAEITQSELKDNTVLIAEYETPLSDGSGIDALCDVISGTAIEQGETFSLRGQIASITEDNDDVIENASQMAGTLYNAALLADMEILERHPHEYPQDYLPPGLDAAIDADNDKDLKIKNNADSAVYIIAFIDSESKTLCVRLHGAPQEDGVRIEIVSIIMEELSPTEEIVELTQSLSPGEKVVTQPGKTGYEVAVFRNYYLNNRLKNSEIIYQDTYSPQAATILLGIDRSGK